MLRSPLIRSAVSLPRIFSKLLILNDVDSAYAAFRTLSEPVERSTSIVFGCPLSNSASIQSSIEVLAISSSGESTKMSIPLIPLFTLPSCEKVIAASNEE